MVEKELLRPLLPSPALLHQEGRYKTLIVGDLHLGYERALAEVGINIPSQTLRLQKRLTKIIREVKPRRLVIAGDVKHSIPSISTQEWGDIPQFFEKLKIEVPEIDVVPGNHDGDLKPLLPLEVNLRNPRGIVIGDKDKVGVFHGHTWPFPQLLAARNLVMAHNHPMIQFRDPSGFRIIKPVWIKAPCDEKILATKILKNAKIKEKGDNIAVFIHKRFGIALEKMSLIVLPAFNDILGGVVMNKAGAIRYIGPLLRSGVARIDDAEMYLLDGTYIGLAKDQVQHLFRIERTR